MVKVKSITFTNLLSLYFSAECFNDVDSSTSNKFTTPTDVVYTNSIVKYKSNTQHVTLFISTTSPRSARVLFLYLA